MAARASARSTVFLDRDGTINVKPPEGDYVKSWDEFEFLPGAVAAVRALVDAGLLVVIVTNQRGIALGRMSEEDLAEIHRRMVAEIGRDDVAIYHCPHDKDECDCRKPRTGMFRDARRDHPEIDFGRSVMIGDSESDLEAGRAIGARVVRIGVVPDAVPSLADAARLVLGPD